MPQRPEPDDGGVLMDDYPRIQRRPDPLTDPENQGKRGRRFRLPRVPWRRVGVLGGVAVVGAVVGWCLHPDTKDTGGEARTALAENETRVKALEAELSSATGAAATEKAAATSLIEARAQRAALAEATTKAIVDALATAAGDHAVVTSAGAEVRVQIAEKALFRPGEVELTAAGHEVLSSIGTALADPSVVDKLIWVEGHTDDAALPRPKPAKGGKARAKAKGKASGPGAGAMPGFASPWELAAARSIAVVRYLQDQVKIDPRRLGVAAFGHYRPIGNARARNRRIELVLHGPPAEQ